MRALLFFTAFWFLSFLSANPLRAQTAMDVNEGCRIEKDGTTGVFTMSWWGRSGRTYFIQHSDDLVTWTYLPLIESGAAAVTEYGFTSTAARGFFRLRASDAPAGGDPDAADFDGDGLTNVQEVGTAGTHTDPLAADTDGDGLSDGAEAAAGTNPRLKDTDGDGFGDALELQAGTSPLTAASSPLHTGQMMLANLLSLWTAYLPVSQTGSLSQQQAAWDAAVEVQEELAALLALVAAAMPESLLMVPVSQPFGQLPLTMPQSQTPPTGDPGKAWLDTWSHEALIGLGQDSYNTDTTLRFSGPNLENYYSMYVDSWDDGHEEGRPVDPQLKRTNFILAVNQAGTYMDEETAKAGNVLDDYGPSWSRQWGAADFVNPASERMVLEVSQNPLGAWALKWFYRICRLRVERAADHERSFVMLAMHWKPATGWQCEGTVTFRVQPQSLEAGIEISGLPWEWFRDNGDLLEMGTLNPLPPALQSLPPGFVSDREKYQLVPVEVRGPATTPASTIGTDEIKTKLRVAKMEDSLDENDILDIDIDPDRFFVRIPDLPSTQAVSIKLATVDNPKPEKYDDDETEIELEPAEDEPGTWRTKSLLLVSDDVDDLLGDDQDQIPYGLDDELNDRTHKVQLKGNVKIAAIKVNGSEFLTDIRTPVPADGKIRAQVFRMSDATESIIGVDLQIDVANERLAQLGYYLDASPACENILIPDPDRAGSWSNSKVWASSYSMTNFLNIYGTLHNVDDTQIFFVNRTVDANGGNLWGFASLDNIMPIPSQGTINTIWVQQGIFTLAHELGHLLTRRGHYGDPANLDGYEPTASAHKKRHALMRNGGLDDFNSPGGGKRFYDIEAKIWIPGNRILSPP